MENLSVQEFVRERIDLMSLPDVAIELNKLCDDKNSTAQDIADVIATDATLTARLLKVVNSPFYNFPQQVDTITMAITILGISQLRDLAMATLIIQKFNNIPEGIVTPEKFWSHNIACATAAKTIVSELGIKQSERVFVAGLLHDIGKMLMYLSHPNISIEVLGLVKDNSELDITQIEEVAFGFSHAEAGAALLSEWGLPESLIEPVKFHHHPDRANRFAIEASVLHLANAVANEIEPLFQWDKSAALEEKIWTILNTTSEHMSDITTTSKELYDETVRIFYPQKKVA